MFQNCPGFILKTQNILLCITESNTCLYVYITKWTCLYLLTCMAFYNFRVSISEQHSNLWLFRLCSSCFPSHTFPLFLLINFFSIQSTGIGAKLFFSGNKWIFTYCKLRHLTVGEATAFSLVSALNCSAEQPLFISPLLFVGEIL